MRKHVCFHRVCPSHHLLHFEQQLLHNLAPFRGYVTATEHVDPPRGGGDERRNPLKEHPSQICLERLSEGLRTVQSGSVRVGWTVKCAARSFLRGAPQDSNKVAEGL